ncbi:MAG: hypothetical protein R3250_08410 [Melioribacteraceae bacterium]|nr:hypothetical protein [Melioribacteraceae bacterium]
MEERKLLEEVAKTLETNLNLLNERLNRIDVCNNSGEIVLSIIDNNSEYKDTLGKHFWFAFYNVSKVFLSEAGYQPMKYTGGKLILNEQLKYEIVNLFEVKYQFLLSQLEWGIKDDPETHPFLDEHFIRDDRGNLKPFNFDAISDNTIFYSLLNKAKSQRTWFEMLISDSKKETERVLRLIEEELGEE